MIDKVLALGAVLPTNKEEALYAARRLLADARAGEELFSFIAGSCAEAQIEIQSELYTKELPRRPDLLRYRFILNLAEIYQRLIGQPPTTTRDGPWCSFLALVLSRCGSRKISNNGAYDAWRKARNWAKRSFNPSAGRISSIPSPADGRQD
jgi:hypothetical protein